MPYNIVPGHLYRLTVQGRQAGQAVINRVHYESFAIGGGGAGMNSTQALQAFQTAYRAELLPSLTVEYQVLKYVLEEIGSGVAAPPPTNWTFPVINQDELLGDAVGDSGSAAGDPLPTFCSFPVRLRASALGRAGRGWLRLGGTLESYTTGNQYNAGITATLLTGVQDSYAVITNGVPPADREELRWGIWSQKNARALPGPAPDPLGAFSEIISSSARIYVGTVNSRKQSAGGA